MKKRRIVAGVAALGLALSLAACSGGGGRSATGDGGSSTDNKGALEGRLEKLFRAPGSDQNPKCDKCEGALKDQPVQGMVFMSGLRKDGDEYSGGEILDPDNGKVYKSKIKLIDGGKKLSVRGYIGMPMFGRSQVWVREE